MPYKAEKNRVLIKRKDRWVLFKMHNTHQEALDHAAALNAAKDEDKKDKEKDKE